METNLTTLSDQLPEQIHLKQVLKLIGLDDRPIEDALYRLGLHSQYDGLELYFSDEVLAEDSIFGEHPIRFGRARGYPGCPSDFFSNIEGKKRIHELDIFHNAQGDFVGISTFWCQESGIFYHCVDPESWAPKPVTIEYNQLYVDKVELQEFCTKLEVSGTEIPNQEQRAVLAGIGVHDESRLSEPPNKEALLENPKPSNHLDPTWDDLLINPPKTDSEIFTHFKNAVINYIKREKQLPLRNQVWEELKSMFKFDDKKRVIIGLSSKPMDRENFRTNYRRYTTKPRQKQDK